MASIKYVEKISEAQHIFEILSRQGTPMAAIVATLKRNPYNVISNVRLDDVVSARGYAFNNELDILLEVRTRSVISGEAIRGLIVNYFYTKEKGKKLKPQKKKACDECLEKFDKDTKSFLYSGHTFCEECYEEHRQVCDKCDAKEEAYRDFNTYPTEDNGIFKDITVCYNCIEKLTLCSRKDCNAIINKTEKTKCQQDGCSFHYCSVHAHAHKCKQAEPRFLFRDYTIKRQNGDIKNAKSIKDNRCVGIELEAIDGNPKNIRNLDGRIGIAHDGSLDGNNPIELQTPPASANQLEYFIENATKSLREAGFRVNKSCGIHMHIDSEDFKTNGQKIFRIVSIYYALEPLLYAMLPLSRRTNRFALPLRNWLDEVKMLELTNRKTISLQELEYVWYKSRNDETVTANKGRKYDTSRYQGFNLHALFSTGHMELRHHQGSLNATKIKNWINLNLLIVGWALNSYNGTVVNALHLAQDVNHKLRIMTRRMGLTRESRRYIKRGLKKFSGNEEDND